MDFHGMIDIEQCEYKGGSHCAKAIALATSSIRMTPDPGAMNELKTNTTNLVQTQSSLPYLKILLLLGYQRWSTAAPHA